MRYLIRSLRDGLPLLAAAGVGVLISPHHTGVLVVAGAAGAWVVVRSGFKPWRRRIDAIAAREAWRQDEEARLRRLAALTPASRARAMALAGRFDVLHRAMEAAAGKAPGPSGRADIVPFRELHLRVLAAIDELDRCAPLPPDPTPERAALAELRASRRRELEAAMVRIEQEVERRIDRATHASPEGDVRFSLETVIGALEAAEAFREDGGRRGTAEA